MVAVSWANTDILRSPALGQFRGQDDFEALLAISHFTRVLAVDLSGTLAWPFAHAPIYDYSTPMTEKAPAQCLDDRSQAIWSSSPSQVAVLCAGDIDSVAVLAAVYKHAPAASQVVVRYTQAGVARYPKLFQDIAPSLGMTMESRDGQPLVGDSQVLYCDGRSGDDWQAGYQASVLGDLRWLTDGGTAEGVADYISQRYSESTDYQAAARRGLMRFANGVPFPVVDAWSLIVAIYRYCVTQHDVLNGPITEDDPAHAFSWRLPFYDTPAFTSASMAIASQGVMPQPDDESLALRQYALSVFGDDEWAQNERPSSVYYFYRLGRYNTHWLDDQARPHYYTEFPVGGQAGQPASWEVIKHWRDTYEVAPVTTSFGTFDADERSDARMADAVELFDNLPTLDQDGKLTWKRADNSFIKLTKTELQAVYAELKANRADRGALLHVKAEVFRQIDPRPTPAQLSDLSFWLEE